MNKPADLPPGPPKKDPEERIEPDPSWRWAPQVRRSELQVTPPEQGMAPRTLYASPMALDDLTRALEVNLERDPPLPFFRKVPGEPVGTIRFFTKCRVPGAGFHHSHGGLVATEHFVVLTHRTWDPSLGDYEHGVITAFPVHPDG